MAAPEAAPSWEVVDSAFEFDLPRPQHIPRAWERAPKSPHRAHQKGRKLWKRPVPRALGGPDCPQADQNRDERRALADLSNNTPRAVKKLRIKDQDAARETKGTRGSRYLATLRDITQSTPRSKAAFH
ncbi:MAG: hypothetical protein OHK93_003212 [Ramalina farinacea]|uniref:Uncharacterized protein n=1 Tax=Ramalina farinacea TaxID=258253 RepID=A0AA43TUH2_9LECA|nr:hypothetical protein [Ramalina farinacea]